MRGRLFNSRFLNQILNLVHMTALPPRVLCAEHFIGDEPFAVLLGDDIMVSDTPALSQLIDVYNQHGTEQYERAPFQQPVSQSDPQPGTHDRSAAPSV
jgi:hypothetical protein